MSFRPRPAPSGRPAFSLGATGFLALGATTLFAVGATTLHAQYSTPVGKGAAKPKTLRATAVLEWTGPLEKPNASRLMPVAVWDGEHYQPAGLYLARPDPLALESGTQYQLERAGDPVGLYNVRAAAELNGSWVGLGRFQAEAPPPPPPKLKPSKHLPVLSNGKPDTPSGTGTSSAGDRPTLHRKTSDSAPAPDSGTASTGSANTTGNAGATSNPGASTTTPAATSQGSTGQAPAASTGAPASPSSTASSSDSSQPTLHRRTADSDSGSSGPASSDSDAPTLHRRDESSAGASTTEPDADTDRPTLHKHSDTAGHAGDDDDRPTLHRAPSSSAAAAAIDPDRPRLRYGAPDDSSEVVLPTRLKGMPPGMQQVVAVSDSGPLDPRPYQYHWASPDDAAKMQTALAALAEQAIAKPNPAGAKPAAQFGPAARAAARKARSKSVAAPPPALVDVKFAAYELTFSGGATLVYTAHTSPEGPQRVYVTLIAQPDFSGNPQVLLQQVAHGDRLDETPAMQLVDAVDTDGDQRAELIFQLTGASTIAAPDSSAAPSAYDGPGDANAVSDAAAANAAAAASRATAAAAVPEREFAIYRVANGKAVQVFDTGPLP